MAGIPSKTSAELWPGLSAISSMFAVTQYWISDMED